MAVLTTDTKLFYADGASDPKIGFKGVTFMREIDFGITNAEGAVNYEFIGLPQGFVALALGIEELDECPAGTVTAKVKSDSAALGTAVTVGGADLAKNVQTVSKAFNAGDMLCIVPSVKMDSGRIRVSVSGVMPNSDTRYSPELEQPYRMVGNTRRNVAEPDRRR